MSSTQEEARDAVIDLRTFTQDALMYRLDCSKDEAKDHIQRLLDRGTIIDVGFLKNGKRGRPPHVYCWSDPKIFHRPKPHAERQRHKPPEHEVSRHVIRGGHAASGRKKGKKHKDLEKLFKIMEAKGWLVDRARNHPRLTAPDGDIYTVAGSPSDPRTFANTKAMLDRKERELSERR